MANSYVVGLMFSPDKSKVVLIQKNRPEWQKGKLNGIGGKKEKTDFSLFHTMVREFEEETGVKTKVEDWTKVITLTNPESETITFFKSFYKDYELCKTTIDEKIIILNLPKLIDFEGKRPDVTLINLQQQKLMDNLFWIIPLCFDNNISKAEAQSLI